MTGMRTEAFLSILIMTLAFASGALVLSIKNGPEIGMTAPILQQGIQNFTKSTSAIDHFRTESISEIIDPQNTFPSYFKFEYDEIQSLLQFAKTCRPTKLKRSAALLKTWQWEEYKCGHRDLNKNFFSISPFIHPVGHSFAYLAKKDSEWARKNLNLFHVSELRDLQISDLPAPYRYFESLDINSMSGLLAGDAVVMTDEFVFVNSYDDSGYAVYSLNEWMTFWLSTPFNPQPDTVGKTCFVKENSVCWVYDFKKAFFPKWNPFIFLLGLFVMVAISTFVLLAVRIYRRHQDQVRLKFTLEMLAHEIRTPVANLAFTVESFRSKFDRFPDDAKSQLLRLFDQVERIKRVADSSRNYLNKEIGTDLIRTNFVEITSLAEFIHHTLDSYLSQIEVEINDEPKSISLDPYWTSICIKNLVENAILHGIKPVKVTVNQQGKAWSIEISDQGTKSFDPMSKGDRSSGFGLGIKIVKNILPYLHASMEISFQPTRIKIFFGDVK